MKNTSLDNIVIDIAEYSSYLFIAILFYLWFRLSVFCGVHFSVDIIASVLVLLIATYAVWGFRKRLRVLNNFIVNVYFSILSRMRLYAPIKHSVKNVENGKTP